MRIEVGEEGPMADSLISVRFHWSMRVHLYLVKDTSIVRGNVVGVEK